ncbi:MAG: thiamine biosynthesis protein ThiF, partial [Desulfobacterales bacterium]|nr:thiamine biosynthesis protein ThiF [Desulfobacterales bacterium]
LLQSRRRVVWGGLTCFALAMICLAYLPRGTGSWLLACLFGGLGVFGSTGGVMYTHIKELVPSRLTGTAMTGVNFFTMIGAALFTQILGSLVNVGDPRTAFGPAAFRSPFLVCAGCLAAAAGMYRFTRDPGPGAHGKTPPV